VIVTDPIADMLTRIRNAYMVSHKSLVMPYSKFKKEVAKVLKEEGYISSFEEFEDENKHKNLKIKLRYVNDKKVVSGLKRISKPGLRVYVNHKDLPRVLGGLGIAIISTSTGVMTDRQARYKGVGGEVVCYVW